MRWIAQLQAAKFSVLAKKSKKEKDFPPRRLRCAVVIHRTQIKQGCEATRLASSG
ncbi:hypothetical protein RR47_GL001365 [Enterococcus columbae DSM 7374 = ATCC 51263]|nr:hypothetical protein RR47_GL001365 [Enterococcus columbae DSM 7374 = ATCC 51263]